MIDINSEVASKLKAATVGIGLLREGDKRPTLVGGTGFIIDSEGFLITASHVIDGLEEVAEKYNKNNQDKLRLCATIVFNKEDKIDVITLNISVRGHMYPIIPKENNYTGPKNYDLAMARIRGKDFNLPKLVIKKPSKLELYKNILMCGYPGGNTTLNITNPEYGMKVHPIMQKGMISSIMPADHTAAPTGIITDIIGTGGSSGSPIVDADDGELISVAQNVVGSEVEVSEGQPALSGMAKVGLVFGVANFLLEPVATSTLTHMKSLLDKNGDLLNRKESGVARDLDLSGKEVARQGDENFEKNSSM